MFCCSIASYSNQARRVPIGSPSSLTKIPKTPCRQCHNSHPYRFNGEKYKYIHFSVYPCKSTYQSINKVTDINVLRCCFRNIEDDSRSRDRRSSHVTISLYTSSSIVLLRHSINHFTSHFRVPHASSLQTDVAKALSQITGTKTVSQKVSRQPCRIDT